MYLLSLGGTEHPACIQWQPARASASPATHTVVSHPLGRQTNWGWGLGSQIWGLDSGVGSGFGIGGPGSEIGIWVSGTGAGV